VGGGASLGDPLRRRKKESYIREKEERGEAHESGWSKSGERSDHRGIVRRKVL